MKKHTNKKGFTIVELVIVIAVIAILSAVLIPTFSSITQKANETADVQALTTMNKYLAMEEAEDKPDNIMDVYEALDEYNIKAETYNPLYKDRYYFYDVSLNRILYTDASYNVIAPQEYKNVTKSGSWLTLSGVLPETKVTPTVADGKQTYTVTTAEQFNYVTNHYDASANTVIVLENDIDLMGCAAAFEKTITGSITIIGSDEENPTVIKNFVGNNQYNATEKSSDDTIRNYNSGFIADVKGYVHLENLVFDNCHIETATGGNVAVVVGSLASTSGNTIKNVTVKNSTVKGNRSVGAIVGMCYDVTAIQDCTIENVQVYTASGRSGLIAGLCSMTTNQANVTAMCASTNVAVDDKSSLQIWDACKTAQVTAFTVKDKTDDSVIDSTGWVLCEKADKPNEYRVHCDDALTWYGGAQGAYNIYVGDELMTVENYYIVK